MLCILSKEFFLEFFDSLEVAVSVQLCTFLHSSERSPALRIYDIGIFECLSHIICLCKCTAGFLCVLGSNSLNFREYLVSFRMSKYNVHSETCHQTDDSLRNGEWFAVGRRVSP